jgi:lipoate-protein ligase A
MSIFDTLQLYRDDASRSAAMNMAIDEALLEIASAPSIRFYRWGQPALSFGYFGKFGDVAEHERERDLVRRWTGGGIVFHGDDLTYSIIIPANDSVFAESSTSIYEQIHRAVSHALLVSGENAKLATEKSPNISESCFANAVRADVLVNGRKVAGAAQRRTRRGLLQQGSIQHVDLAEDFGERFAQELSPQRIGQELNGPILDRAREIAANKYGTAAWLRRR